jgi:hypothetical protein
MLMKNRIKKRRLYARRKSWYIPLISEDRAWLNMSPVGREFGSPDYERLAQLDALANTAAVVNGMKENRSGTIDQATFSEIRKKGRR